MIMKLLAIPFAIIALLIPANALAAPVSWDFTSNVLQPLQSGWTAEIKGSFFTATNTSATSTFPRLYAPSAFRLGSDYLTDLTGTGLTISGSALTLDATGNWTGTFDGQEGSWYTANSFSTTSAESLLRSYSGLTDEFCFTYESSGSTFVWQTCGSGSSNTFTYPLVDSGGVVSLAFGTTTPNSWSAHNIFSSLFATNASSTNATTTSLYVTGLTSALSLFDANGQATEYAGTSCTDQFIRSISASGVATCATVANTDLANSTVSYGGVTLSLGGTDATPAFNLVDATGLPIVAGTTGTLTVARGGTGTTTAPAGQVIYGGGAGVYQSVATGTVTSGTGISLTGTVAVLLENLVIAVNQAANFVWTGVHDFGGAVLEIPNGTNPTTDATGECAWDTTTGQLRCYDGSANRVLSTGFIDASFVISTSTMGTGTTTKKVAGFKQPWSFTAIGCSAIGSGTFVAQIGDGTSSTTAVVSTTGNTTSFTTLSANNSFTTGEVFYIAIGSVSGTVTDPSCSYQRSYTAD